MVVGCQQLAEALAAVHAEGIMHHDCRLGNLLLKLPGQA